MIFEDLRTACRKDPALHGVHVVEVLLYPGLWAIWSHRVAHRLYRLGVPLVPRLLSQLARALTGIEIHPGAVVGRRCFIDHGMGVVIGETAVLGDDVMLYHRVTLGGTGWWTDTTAAKRHPTIGDRVVLGVGATVLGPVHVGHDTIVGAHALVLRDVPARSRVHAPSTALSNPGCRRPGLVPTRDRRAACDGRRNAFGPLGPGDLL
ncbi:serine O-acetyltransferase [Streptomyces europaeiscabiei]|uniref:serine O-acetyltransferase EpsC n=1 Tax=Streptomyces europaeiscabiei TaxID=146819 RepID=UPI0029BE71F0|nr:serine O-acetyltransferase EpsC [Streptomyces europaeiscabiei]MDX3715003.1 serine O-acetyltransferase [Streptomyces europaeiscabiei]